MVMIIDESLWNSCTCNKNEDDKQKTHSKKIIDHKAQHSSWTIPRKLLHSTGETKGKGHVALN